MVFVWKISNEQQNLINTFFAKLFIICKFLDNQFFLKFDSFNRRSLIFVISLGDEVFKSDSNNFFEPTEA